LGGVADTLARLIDRGLVARLGRRPGQKEERYRELLGEDADGGAGPPTAGGQAPGTVPAPGEPGLEDRVVVPSVVPPAPPPVPSGLEERVGRLERALGELRDDDRMGRLEREVAALREALGG